MRIKYYIGVYGSQNVIRAFHAKSNFDGAKIKPLKSCIALDKDVLWEWCSPHQECLSYWPEEEVVYYLNENLSLLQQIKMYRKNFEHLIVMIVCYPEEGERHRGYHISSELIGLLADMEAVLEKDVIDYY